MLDPVSLRSREVTALRLEELTHSIGDTQTLVARWAGPALIDMVCLTEVRPCGTSLRPCSTPWRDGRRRLAPEEGGL